MKGIKFLITLFVIIIRFYCVFKVAQGLYMNYNYNYPLDDVQRYLYFLILDLYMVKIMDNSVSIDIYSKKEDESKVNK